MIQPMDTFIFKDGWIKSLRYNVPVARLAYREESEVFGKILAASGDLMNAAVMQEIIYCRNPARVEELKNFARLLGWVETIPIELFAIEYQHAALQKALGVI